MTQKDFAFRIDRWTDDGERIIEHVAGAEGFHIAMATYHADRVATLEEAKAQLRKSWDAWKAWAKLEEVD
jgi:23S rRNA pseudoU1915 N3-methylase RlmH